jgi:hypothetical protein
LVLVVLVVQVLTALAIKGVTAPLALFV